MQSAGDDQPGPALNLKPEGSLLIPDLYLSSTPISWNSGITVFQAKQAQTINPV